MKQLLIYFGIFICLTTNLFGQLEESIGVVSLVDVDSTVLRWAPVNDTLFRLGLANGYEVSKYTLEGDSIRSWQMDAWSLMEWRANVDSTRFDNMRHRYAAIAAEMTVGDGPEFSEGMLVSQQDIDESRFTYALMAADFSALAADGLGLRLVDRHRDGDGPYIYQVQIRDTGAVGFTVADPENRNEALVPLRPEARQGDRWVEVLIQHEPVKNLIAGFFLEKSESPSGPFALLNSAPMVPQTDQELLSFKDSLQENYRSYYYRVKAVTVFGDLTDPSEILMVSGRDFTPPVSPTSVSAVEKEAQTIFLEWEWEGKEEIEGFGIFRSSSYQGEYELIDSQLLDGSARNYLDRNPIKELPNYYRIGTIDTAGNIGQSLDAMVTLDDYEAPPIVTDLMGTIDTAGRVKLEWGESPAIDLIGYRVYYANAPDHTFTILNSTPLPFPDFFDSTSLNTLTPFIYYRVSAVDNNYNESEMSEILELQKPLTVSIQQPILYDHRVDESGIVIRWARCSNSLADGYILQRRDNASTEWTDLAIISDITQDSYRDTSALAGEIVHFRLKTTSQLAHESTWSREISVQMLQKRISGQIAVSGSKVTDGIQLTWNYNRRGDYYLVVYRESSEGKLKYLEKISEGDEYFLDQAPSAGINSYALRAHHADGSKSSYSPVIAIDY